MSLPPQRYELRPTPALSQGNGRAHEDLGIGEVWAGLVRNRWIILGCTLLMLGGAVLYTLREIPVYDGFTTIRIQEQELNLSEIYHTMSTGIAGSDLGTEMEVLESRALREEAAGILGLQVQVVKPERTARETLIQQIIVSPTADEADYRLVRRADGRFGVFLADSTREIAASGADGVVRVPGASFLLTPAARRYDELEVQVQSFGSAVDRVGSGLVIGQPRRDAYVVTVSYSDPDSLLARDVPNVITARYMARRQSGRAAEAGNTVKFLEEQLARVSLELAGAEDTFRLFQERQQVLDPQAETSGEVARLITKESDRSVVEAEREALAKSLAEIDQKAAHDPGGPSPYRLLIGLPFLLRNQAASTLLTSLINAENDRAALVRRTARDPDMEVLNAKIEDLERQLHSITTTYLQGLSNQVESMNTALGRFQHQLDAVPAKQLQFARLDRKVKGQEEIFTLLQGRLKEAEIAAAAKDPSVQVVDTAVAPDGPSSPNPKLNGMVAVALGLAIGIGVAFVREYRDKSVHTRTDIVIATGVPVLGLIPRIPRATGRIALITERLRLSPPGASRKRNVPASRRHTFLASESAAGAAASAASAAGAASPAIQLTVSSWGAAVAEAYGLLQTNLTFAHTGPPIKTVVITSPLAEDGKTTCATNLAITLALRGSRTLLVDADLRRGVVHAALDVSRAPGLSEVLSGSMQLNEVIRRVKVGQDGGELHFLTTGALPANPSGLLESGFPRMMALAREQFDAVIVDSPPANIIGDASVLGLHADCVLVVARSGVTQSAALAYATEQLARVGVQMLGVVLNDIDFKREAGYDASYRQYTTSKYLSASRES